MIKQTRRRLWRSMLHRISRVSPVIAAQLLYFRKTGKYLNVRNPRDFNEKLQWLKIYWRDPLMTLCADKYEMHQYVTRQGGGNALNTILAVYDSPEEIDWEELPQRFALKCTHGCGYNIVTRNKHELDPEAVKRKLTTWMGEKFGQGNLEPHYDEITPRIILERYIENRAGQLPMDYKIYCFNGVAKLVEVCSERERELKLDFFDLAWNRLAISFETLQRDTPPERPACFEEMVAYAEQLAQPFPFVRMDFYDNDGVPILGELTFTPGSSMSTCYSEYGLRYLGDLLTLPEAPFDRAKSSTSPPGMHTIHRT